MTAAYNSSSEIWNTGVGWTSSIFRRNEMRPNRKLFPNQKASEEKEVSAKQERRRILGIRRQKDKAMCGNQWGAQLKRSRSTQSSGTKTAWRMPP
jgi:hypothetical protein